MHLFLNDLIVLNSSRRLLVCRFSLVWPVEIAGDRSNHIATLHLPQLCYFAVFATAALGFSLPASRSFRSLVVDGLTLHHGSVDAAKRKVVSGAGGVRAWMPLTIRIAGLGATAFILAFCIRRFTYVCTAFLAAGLQCDLSSHIVLSAILPSPRRFEHPFLLADNRHLTFYIWRHVFRRWAWARFALIPVYILCAVFLNHTLRTSLPANCDCARLFPKSFDLCNSHFISRASRSHDPPVARRLGCVHRGGSRTDSAARAALLYRPYSARDTPRVRIEHCHCSR